MHRRNVYYIVALPDSVIAFKYFSLLVFFSFVLVLKTNAVYMMLLGYLVLPLFVSKLFFENFESHYFCHQRNHMSVSV